MSSQSLRVGLAGLGAVGRDVAKRLIAGVPGLTLTAVSVRDVGKAQQHLPEVGKTIPVLPPEALAAECDLVIECLPPALFRAVATSAIEQGKLFMPLSVGKLLENWNLTDRARETG